MTREKGRIKRGITFLTSLKHPVHLRAFGISLVFTVSALTCLILYELSATLRPAAPAKQIKEGRRLHLSICPTLFLPLSSYAT